jgi:hypothetical protein
MKELIDLTKDLEKAGVDAPDIPLVDRLSES